MDNIVGDSEGMQANYAYDQWPYASIGLQSQKKCGSCAL